MQNNIIEYEEEIAVKWWVNVAEWVDIVCGKCIRQDYCALDVHMFMCKNVYACDCECECV